MDFLRSLIPDVIVGDLSFNLVTRSALSLIAIFLVRTIYRSFCNSGSEAKLVAELSVDKKRDVSVNWDIAHVIYMVLQLTWCLDIYRAFVIYTLKTAEPLALDLVSAKNQLVMDICIVAVMLAMVLVNSLFRHPRKPGSYLWVGDPDSSTPASPGAVDEVPKTSDSCTSPAGS